MMSFGTRQLLDTQPDGTITIRGISPFSKTDCYVVTAFKSSKESLDSNKWCGAQDLAMGTATVDITPTKTVTAWGTWPVNCGDHNPPAQQPNAEGIYKYDGESTDGADYGAGCSADWVAHTFWGFALDSKIAPQKVISKVRLVAYLDTSRHLYYGDSGAKLPCGITGAEEVPQWWSGPHASDPQQTWGVANSHVDVNIHPNGVSADITPWVKENRWFGFQFTLEPRTDTQDTCMAFFQNVHLSVTYYP